MQKNKKNQFTLTPQKPVKIKIINKQNGRCTLVVGGHEGKKGHIHKLVSSEGSLADCTPKTYAPEVMTYNKGKIARNMISF
jgi:hypothetical protein